MLQNCNLLIKRNEMNVTRCDCFGGRNPRLGEPRILVSFLCTMDVSILCVLDVYYRMYL